MIEFMTPVVESVNESVAVSVMVNGVVDCALILNCPFGFAGKLLSTKAGMVKC